MSGELTSERRDWAMLVVLCAAGLLSGVLEVLFVPLYLGAVLVPVVVLLGIVGNIALPRLGFVLVPTTVGALAPFLAWLVPVLGLALFPRPEGDVLVAGGGGQQWVFYALLLLGCVCGFGTLVSELGGGGSGRVSR